MRSKDIAVGYAIGYNDGLGQGGGTISDKWTRPSDWPKTPEPTANQIVMLVTTQWNTAPQETFQIYAHKYGSTPTKFDGKTNATVDWGDGQSETITLPNTGTIAFCSHYFYDIITGTWNSGPILDNGAHVFVITVTLPDNTYIDTGSLSGGLLEIYVGANVKFYNTIARNKVMLEHVKFFGWQPKSENNAGDTYGIMSGNNVLQSVEATEPLNIIPLKAFMNCFSLSDIDLSNCVAISDMGLQNTAITVVESKALSTIGAASLASCYELQKVIAPNLKVISSVSAFSNCYNISEVVIPDDCTYPSGTFQDLYKWYDNPEKEHPELN